jgi:hypothetical protein
MSIPLRLLTLIACVLSRALNTRALLLTNKNGNHRSYAIKLNSENGNTDNTPVPSLPANSNILKGIAAVAATTGLVVGKRLYDGPTFEEPVSLKGKTVVITVRVAG